ncbi:ribbon-helix-helix domain-containing protein [Haloplanus sp. C73]|uniref:ribbon-helix-helix domain-containing protein n=1 Tax=Haloplanus sp. C73 TaxID=3421641 RepID=UPI003EB898A3
MVKSTVRFPESVVGEIESLVEDGRFESKSEFYRFSTDYVLNQVLDDYDPETIDYREIKAEVMPAEEQTLGSDTDREEPPFLESVSFVRKLALRGKFNDAEDFIDHQYAAGDRHAILLEEMLRLYRADRRRRAAPAPAPDPEERERPDPMDRP